MKAERTAKLEALLERVVTEVGRTITPELRADIDQALARCKCNFRQRMVGDGCEVCNPDYARPTPDDKQTIEEAARQGYRFP